jgi:Uma2 family endonuclease
MRAMTAPLWPPVDRPLTVADLDDTPDDGCRYELDDGVLVVSPAPRPLHQIVLHRLQLLLDAACPPEFQVVPGPGVEMSEIQYRIPDLVVVRAALVSLTDASVTRPPELAVEVASPSTAHYDRGRKKMVYADFGIPVYWIVVPDPDRPSITEYRLTDGSYAQTGFVAGEQRFSSEALFPVDVVPAELVAGPWRRDPSAP